MNKSPLLPESVYLHGNLTPQTLTHHCSELHGVVAPKGRRIWKWAQIISSGKGDTGEATSNILAQADHVRKVCLDH